MPAISGSCPFRFDDKVPGHLGRSPRPPIAASSTLEPIDEDLGGFVGIIDVRSGAGGIALLVTLYWNWKPWKIED